MTVPWAARVLGVAPRTLYDAINRGEFECIRIRRRVLVKTQYLVDLLGTGLRMSEVAVTGDGSQPRAGDRYRTAGLVLYARTARVPLVCRGGCEQFEGRVAG